MAELSEENWFFDFVFKFLLPKRRVKRLNLAGAGGIWLELSNDVTFIEIGWGVILWFTKSKVPCQFWKSPSCTRIDGKRKIRKQLSKQETHIAQKQVRKKSYAEKSLFSMGWKSSDFVVLAFGLKEH